MALDELFDQLADALDGDTAIEATGRAALRDARSRINPAATPSPLQPSILAVMAAPDAHPVCAQVANEPLPWGPPQTSSDPRYVAVSTTKAHVELVGPDGLARADDVRIGLYGMVPNAEYGARTHPAEEVFVMLAGAADWARGDAPYAGHTPGARSWHPSMLPHATRTRASAFLSLYIWQGDVSTDNYVYRGG
ncbi:MAG: dimethylsulfonioproprionate lyase family protein [Pseudomonadota bacterium]